jgi:hypothetical protein
MHTAKSFKVVGIPLGTLSKACAARDSFYITMSPRASHFIDELIQLRASTDFDATEIIQRLDNSLERWSNAALLWRRECD